MKLDNIKFEELTKKEMKEINGGGKFWRFLARNATTIIVGFIVGGIVESFI